MCNLKYVQSILINYVFLNMIIEQQELGVKIPFSTYDLEILSNYY